MMRRDERNGWEIEDTKEPLTAKTTTYQPQNIVAFDLSSSNPNSQYSVTQHGLTSDNTLTNLLMYESQYVPMLRRDMLAQKNPRHPIHENSRESEPTYYHDNTQDHHYESSDDQSEDVLINFLEKMKQSFDYRIRMVMRNAFQQIYLFASRKACEENHVPMELSDSEDISVEKERKTNGRVPPQPSGGNLFNFNSNIKRKTGPTPLLTTAPAKPIPSPNGKSIILSIQLDESAFQTKITQQESYKPSKPILRLLPDSMREQSLDEVGFWDQLDPISFDTSNESPDPEYQMLDCMNKQQMKSNIEQVIQRPSSLYVRAESRPSSNIQMNVQPPKNHEAFDDYGGMGVHKPKPHSPIMLVRPEIKMAVAQPRQKVHITYNTCHDRSHSQFSKPTPHRIQHPSPIPRQRLIKPVQTTDNQINIVRSQYFTMHNRQPERVVERVDIGPKRINSTPTSPMIKRIIRDVPRVLDTRIGTTENTLNSTTPRPLSPNGIGLVSNRNTTGLNSPMDTTPNPQQPSPSKPSSEYFEFTRPSKPSDQPMKPKNKKISIVSNRSGCTSTLNNN